MENENNKHKYYKIKIKELLQKIIQIKANSFDEAVEIAKEKYHKEEYILDSSNFIKVSFGGYREDYEEREEISDFYTEEMKQEAIERIKILELNEKIITDFQTMNVVYVSEIGANIRIANDEEKQFIKKLEFKKQILIYHAIYLKTESQNTLYFLYVDDKKNNWKAEKSDLANGFITPIRIKIEIGIKELGATIKDGKIQTITK